MIKNKLYVYGEDHVQIPGHVHFGMHMLQRCIEHGDAIALTDADNSTSMTFREVGQLAVDVALSLAHIGVKKGDIVAILSEKTMEFLPTFFGIVCAGATFLATEVNNVREHLETIKPKILFCAPRAYSIVKELLNKAPYIDRIIIFGEETEPGATSFKDFLSQHAVIEEFYPVPVRGWEDNAVILHSSGTTGKPKPVPLTHGNFLLCFLNGVVETIVKLRSKTMLSTREWYFAYGLLHTLGFLHAGATVVFTENNTIDNLLQAIDKYKINMIQLVPTSINDLFKSPLASCDVSSLEYMMSTSMPFDSGLSEAIKRKFPNMKGVSQLYGMAEAGCIITDIGAGKGMKAGSVGVACSGTVIKVVDIVSRKAVGPNKRGEICFKSHSLMSGYIGEPGTHHLDEEGFFKSGDIGYYDEDKYFYIVDRVKFMIQCGQVTISPAEIESVLLMHPAVYDAGVTGLRLARADPGEVPVAFVVKQRGATVTDIELVKYVSTNMPSVSLAGGVRFVEKLPRGSGTKLNRSTLKEMLSNRY